MSRSGDPRELASASAGSNKAARNLGVGLSGDSFTDRDREVYEAHSVIECDGLASTRQIAEQMRLPVADVARRLSGMARRGLVSREGEQMWDDTADWILTWHGCAEAEAAVPEHVKLARWLDATEAEHA